MMRYILLKRVQYRYSTGLTWQHSHIRPCMCSLFKDADLTCWAGQQVTSCVSGASTWNSLFIPACLHSHICIYMRAYSNGKP